MPTEAKPTPIESKAISAGVPRVFIEEWLPAAAIGVECMRSVVAPVHWRHTHSFMSGGRDGHDSVWRGGAGVAAASRFPTRCVRAAVGILGATQRLLTAQKILEWAPTTRLGSRTRMENAHSKGRCGSRIYSICTEPLKRFGDATSP